MSSSGMTLSWAQVVSPGAAKTQRQATPAAPANAPAGTPPPATPTAASVHARTPPATKPGAATKTSQSRASSAAQAAAPAPVAPWATRKAQPKPSTAASVVVPKVKPAAPKAQAGPSSASSDMSRRALATLSMPARNSATTQTTTTPKTTSKPQEPSSAASPPAPAAAGAPRSWAQILAPTAAAKRAYKPPRFGPSPSLPFPPEITGLVLDACDTQSVARFRCASRTARALVHARYGGRDYWTRQLPRVVRMARQCHAGYDGRWMGYKGPDDEPQGLPDAPVDAEGGSGERFSLKYWTDFGRVFASHRSTWCTLTSTPYDEWGYAERREQLRYRWDPPAMAAWEAEMAERDAEIERERAASHGSSDSGVDVSAEQEALNAAWDAAYPVTPAEKTWRKRAEAELGPMRHETWDHTLARAPDAHWVSATDGMRVCDEHVHDTPGYEVAVKVGNALELRPNTKGCVGLGKYYDGRVDGDRRRMVSVEPMIAKAPGRTPFVVLPRDVDEVLQFMPEGRHHRMPVAVYYDTYSRDAVPDPSPPEA